MNLAKAAAIAASAYNVCGPKSGKAATPATIGTFGKTEVLRCLGLYADAHDGSLYTRSEITEAREVLDA